MSKPIKKKSLVYGVLSMIFLAILVIDLIAMVVFGNIAPLLDGVDVPAVQAVLNWILGAAFGGMVVTFIISYLIDNRKDRG